MTKNERWVAKAKASNDIRGYLNYLYSDGRRLMATDGHRLHLAPTTLSAGYYNSELIPVDESAKYPDVVRVIPNKGKQCICDMGSLVMDRRGKVELYQLPDGGWINKRYWDQAVGDQEAVVYVSASNGARRIDFDDGRVAVVMGVRL